MSHSPEKPYLEKILEALPRMVSMLDREPGSQTYGSMDRTYWGWKFTDYPGARFQEGAYALAHLYSHSFPGNTLAGQTRVLQWLESVFSYWSAIQYRDGSFDEAYPYERSFAATSFTLFYCGEAFSMVQDHLDSSVCEGVLQTLKNASQWLCDHDETHGILSNHLAAAAAGLYVAYLLTKEEAFKQRSDVYLKRILDHQSSEGWYLEYAGADPGYQTHGSFYLTRLWQHSKQDELLVSLKASASFLSWFIHPDGSLGGEYASRNTEFYFPAAYEMLAPFCEDAASIALFMRPAVARNSHPGLSAMDSFNFFPMFNNYLFASLNATVNTAKPMRCETESQKLFSEAGLYVTHRPQYTAVVGLSKGGVVKAFTPDSSASDCGYWGRIGKKTFSSQTMKISPDVVHNGDNLEVQATMSYIKQKIFKPWLFLGFRGFIFVFSRIPGVAHWLKGLLVRVLVTGQKEIPVILKRRICFHEDRIQIEDRLEIQDKTLKLQLFAGNRFSSIHMGSSRYYLASESSLEKDPDEDLGSHLNRNGVLTRTNELLLNRPSHRSNKQ